MTTKKKVVKRRWKSIDFSRKSAERFTGGCESSEHICDIPVKESDFIANSRKPRKGEKSYSTWTTQKVARGTSGFLGEPLGKRVSASEVANSCKCNACGIKWPEHLGIQGTCEKLKKARRALEAVNKWTIYDNTKDLRDLCQEALDETK